MASRDKRLPEVIKVSTASGFVFLSFICPRNQKTGNATEPAARTTQSLWLNFQEPLKLVIADFRKVENCSFVSEPSAVSIGMI
jgi:hypothetical protein